MSSGPHRLHLRPDGLCPCFDNFIQIACLLFAWALVILAFFILAIQLFITLIEFKLSTLAGFELIPSACSATVRRNGSKEEACLFKRKWSQEEFFPQSRRAQASIPNFVCRYHSFDILSNLELHHVMRNIERHDASARLSPIGARHAVQEAQRQIVNALTAFFAERWFDDIAAAVGANDAR